MGEFMRRFFGVQRDGQVCIEGEEFNHLKNVLRLSVGDEVLISLGDEYEYACEIVKISKGVAFCQINGQRLCEANPKKNIVLFQALPKREKFEMIVQKATEIGISKVVPFASEYVIAKATENKIDRLSSIARNACKQCERSIPPEIENLKSVDEIIEMFKDFDIVLFANERAGKEDKPKKIAKAQNIAIIVGAEGGFSSKEKDRFLAAGTISVSLGKRILRCETASIAMMSLVSILSDN